MKRVMVVDDDREFLEEITDVLKLSGYETIPIYESRYVVKEASEIKPDIILLDLKMSQLSGFKVAEALRNIPETKDIPVIAITGVYTKEEHQLLVKISGIKKCLIKPIKPLDVITAIEYAERNK